MRNYRTTLPDNAGDRILDTPILGAFLKSLEEQKLGYRHILRSEFDIRYEKFSQICRTVLDDCLLHRPLQEVSLKVLERKKYTYVHFWDGHRKSEIRY
ncbi:hypothetical protein TNCV_1761821 [Trichonephila clavipes]|nr:hypothetical protein TNCV_1761821 [Trichonephila clavipes]